MGKRKEDGWGRILSKRIWASIVMVYAMSPGDDQKIISQLPDEGL